jgi:hypothetical protein
VQVGAGRQKPCPPDKINALRDFGPLERPEKAGDHPQTGFQAALEAFLLSRRVGNCSPRTVNGYAGTLQRFAQTLGVHDLNLKDARTSGAGCRACQANQAIPSDFVVAREPHQKCGSRAGHPNASSTCCSWCPGRIHYRIDASFRLTTRPLSIQRYLSGLRETMKPISVHDYIRPLKTFFRDQRN